MTLNELQVEIQALIRVGYGDWQVTVLDADGNISEMDTVLMNTLRETIRLASELA